MLYKQQAYSNILYMFPVKHISWPLYYIILYIIIEYIILYRELMYYKNFLGFSGGKNSVVILPFNNYYTLSPASNY